MRSRPKKTHLKELGTGLMDGYYDDTVPLGQLSQKNHYLICRHAVQTCGWLIQQDDLWGGG